MAGRLQRRLASWYALITLGGCVVLAAASAAAAAGSTLGIMLAVLAVVGALSVCAAVIVGRTVTQPIREVTAAARRVAAGELHLTVPVQGEDEVSELATAFNELVVRLSAGLEALAAEGDLARAVFTNMTDGIVIVDHELRLERVNPAAARLLQLRSEDVRGQTLAAVVRDHELQRVLTTALGQGAPHAEVLRLAPPPNADQPRRDDARFVRATGIPVRAGARGEPLAGLLVLQDVTELRRVETIRREFVANLSHELRTPLASLKALVETLEEGALDDPPAAREFLSQMHVEVDSLTQMVHELLELSRIESGQVTLRPDTVPPAELAEEAESRLRRQAERGRLTLAVEVADDVAPVQVDPARIVQTLINLIQNAIKFTPAGGEVRVRVFRHPEGMGFSVSDTGIGIAAEDLPRLFERFYKVDRSRASGGTGLGLAIAKHIVQLHGGRIWAESPGEGAGSTFNFVVPLALLAAARDDSAVPGPGVAVVAAAA
jgi:two-component system phosphate regulon sensor histidine kinase PhoR